MCEVEAHQALVIFDHDVELPVVDAPATQQFPSIAVLL